MDITVNVTDFKSLSQSELIMRNLFAAVQIGSTRIPGRGVLLQDARFRSGTVENPLILTLKNSQTETVMYVRNIPISVVLEHGGLLERWVAVYPPGDPQNLHFDAGATPKDGCPQVCISIAVQEDIASTAGLTQRSSMGFAFAPQPRPSAEPAARVDLFRRSQGPQDRASFEVDSTVREKELQAQRIKEHVAEMASAQRRAQDVGRMLQDNTRILEDMKRQLKGLEMQIAEQRAATQVLEQDRDQLRAEELQLQEQIRARDVAFNELRDNRDEIDHELTRVLSEGERQKNAMESSSRDFARQTYSMHEDIDESRRRVAELTESLRGREAALAESEGASRERAAARAEREATEREALRAQLDAARVAAVGARVALEETRRRSQGAQLDRQEVGARLAGLEGEVHSLEGAVEGRGEEGKRCVALAAEAKADLEQKRERLDAQRARVAGLEAELGGNRGQLERLGSRIAELHTEAHDEELAARRVEDERADLQRQLDDRRRSAEEALDRQDDRQGRVAEAESELREAQAALEALERAAAAGEGSADMAFLERRVQDTRDTLADTRRDVDALQKSCEELEAEAAGRRGALEERGAALEAAQARIEELTRELAEASRDFSGSARFCQEAEASRRERQAAIEELQRQTSQQRDELDATRAAAAGAAEAGRGRLAELGRAASEAQAELQRLADEAVDGSARQRDLEGTMAEGVQLLADLRERMRAMREQRAQADEELGGLTSRHAEAAAEFSRLDAELQQLEGARRAGDADLDSTQGAVASKLREVAELESERTRVAARAEAEVAELGSEQADHEREHRGLAADIEAAAAERDRAAEVVASSRRRRDDLDAELKRTLGDGVGLLKDGEDALSHTEALAQTAEERLRARAESNHEAEGGLREAEAHCQAAAASFEALREEVGAEERHLKSAQGKLEEQQGNLAALRAALEGQRARAAELEGAGSNLERTVRHLEERCRSGAAASAELRALEGRREALEDERRRCDVLHEEAAAQQQREAEDTQRQCSFMGAQMLQRTDEELGVQAELFRRLEAERDSLTHQIESLDQERRDLEERVLERERVSRGVEDNSQRKARECDGLEASIRAARSSAAQLEQRHADQGSQAECMSGREAALRGEAEEAVLEASRARGDMASAIAAADRQVDEVAVQLRELRDTCAVEEREADDYRRRCSAMQEELAAASSEHADSDARHGGTSEELTSLRSELAEHRAQRHQQQSLVENQGAELKARAERRSRSASSASAMQQTVREFEDSLQQLSDRLVEAQEAVRRRNVEEEELRGDIQRLKENIRSTNDKMAYQMEHSNLQFETIQKLEGQKTRFEGEVEVLTLGLHEAEQRNEYLQKENSLMQQQVEGLYKGSVQDWAKEVHRVKIDAEVASYREDIDAWKQRTEHMRKEKQRELANVHRQHEETVRRLRDRVASVQAEIDQCKHATQRREAALAKQQEHAAAAPAGALPGLVVPQRPLPAGHERRKALLVGVNYTNSHAPLKGCVNDLWNLQCLLRHTLQYSDDQLRCLIDCVGGRTQKPDNVPTKANIQAGLQWLVGGAQPGDTLLFIFCGYGAQHPSEPQCDEHEGYLVPVDFAEDLPADFFDSATNRSQPTSPSTSCKGYRLIPMLEVSGYISQLPPMCRMSVMLDCCYSAMPGAGINTFAPATFPKVKRGNVDYQKLRDFISRPRFLELPVLPVQHTPAHIQRNPVAKCWLQCFSGSRLEEWAAEFPIEGTVQGAFSWTFLKALARGHFHCGLYQFQRVMADMLADLKVHFRGVEQSFVLQLSESASMQDVVLWT